jgi:CubicO group peptidase (beta-lactamase class C family)
VLAPLTVARMTTAASPVGEPNVRGLGWDLDSSYSANRGELFPLGSYGHTGFTGTSIWVDPSRDLFVILLTNRVNPTRQNLRISGVRTELADVVVRVFDRGATSQPSAPSPR